MELKSCAPQRGSSLAEEDDPYPASSMSAHSASEYA